MRTINIEQRSDLWKTWRSQGVGASESAAVLNLSRYKSPLQLWEEKTDRAFPEFINYHMQRGIELEDDARQEFQKAVGKMFIPLCGEHEKHPMIIASFDGLSKDNKEFVELKAPRGPKLKEALETKDQKVIRNLFPEIWCQCQHQYCVSGAEKGYLASYLDGEITYMLIERDDKFIDEELIPGILNFWTKYVLTDTEPPLSNEDYIYIDDQEAIKLAEEWKDLSQLIKSLQEREKNLKKDLINMGDDGNAIVGNVIKMTRYSAKGRIDTQRLYAHYDIKEEDLNKFRKEEIGMYRFTPLK